MTQKSTDHYRFGDLLALARQSWVAQLANALTAAGYPDYRRSDAAVTRLLRRGPSSIGRLGQAVGVTRQAARKIADNLEQRGLATAARNDSDGRQVIVALTPAGESYAQAVSAVIIELEEQLRSRVEAADLAGADAVLRAVLGDERTRSIAERLAPPGGTASNEVSSA